MGLVGAGLISMILIIFWLGLLILSIYVGILTIQFCKRGVEAIDIYLGKKPREME